MRKYNYYDRESGGCIWKIFGIAGLLFGAVMSVTALLLKKKNDEYRDALIDLSDDCFDCEDTNCRREEWQRAQSPANRKTVEEKLADRRINEDE